MALLPYRGGLALKAFLRSNNVQIEKVHKLTEYYEKCRDLGLILGPDDRVEIANIVELLENGNEDQAFRYFSLESRGVPGSHSSSIEAVTTNPEKDLRSQLGGLLDDNYALHEKMKAASNG